MNKIKDQVKSPETTGLGLGFTFKENKLSVLGEVSATLTYPNGKTKSVLEKKNIYTLDGGVLASMLFKGEAGVEGLKVLALGTGANGDSNSPDIATDKQRRLNSELVDGRKLFSSVVYRKADGTVSSVPTNVVDFTTVFTESEANDALNEMGLIAPIDHPNKNPNDQDPQNRDVTRDLRNYDILVNYLTFPVINKPQGSVLAITWRLTF
jgi:hypothetical protein